MVCKREKRCVISKHLKCNLERKFQILKFQIPKLLRVEVPNFGIWNFNIGIYKGL